MYQHKPPVDPRIGLGSISRKITVSAHRLTIYLLREVQNFADAIAPDKSPKSVPVDASSGVNGVFYYTSRPAGEPPWVSFVRLVTPALPALNTSSASGLLVLKSKGQHFAITFGFGRSLLNPSKIERNFGLRVALNRIDPRQLRSVDTKTFEDMVVTTSTQASKSTDLPTFAVDVSRDILRSVTGEPRDTTFSKRLTGSDAIVLSTNKPINELPALCDELFVAFGEDTYKADFEWIDHLAVVSNADTIEQLNNQLVTQLQAGDTSSTHMAMPEPLDWEEIDSFKITATRQIAYEDIDLDAYLDELGARRTELTIDRLKSRRVSVKFSRSNDYEARWTVYQCLVSEQRLNSMLHVLIEGRWFMVSDSLADEVDAFASSLPAASTALIPSRVGELEADYNRRLAQTDPENLLLLDARIKRPGGATSGIELCDVLTDTGELIHVKRKSRSSTLSHLFAQGSVSASTFIGDGEFRDQIRDVIAAELPEESRDKWLALVPPSGQSVERSRYRISYVVIAKSSKSGTDWLPFFSKLNLMQQGRQLRNLGLGVAISRVETE